MRRLIAITLLALVAVPLADAQSAPAAPSRPPVAQLRQDLQVILDRPEYQQGEGSWLQTYLYRLWHAFRTWYDEHVARHVERLHEVSPVIYWTIVAVVAGAIIVLLYHIFLTLKSAFGTAQVSRQSGGATGDIIETDPAALLKEADAAAATGDFEQALRHLYLALIRNLDRHNLLRYDRSRTNYEYLREVRGQETVAEPLAALTAQAEAVWYGEQPVEAAYYAHCRALALAAWQGETGHAQL
ncbi:MAG: DUF4129 domain-containing protein [Armatimonadota bacterium]